jgi:hypothetical protein
MQYICNTYVGTGGFPGRLGLLPEQGANPTIVSYNASFVKIYKLRE